MAGREGVSLVVPEGFDAYIRLLHDLEGGQRWATVAPDYLRPGVEPYPHPFPHPVTMVEGDMGPELVDALVPILAAATGTPQQCHFGLWTGWGELHPGSSHSYLISRRSQRSPVSVLRARREIRRLERTRRRLEGSLYAFVEACAVQPWWGGRDMLLFDGPIDAVTTIGWPFDGHIRGGGARPALRSLVSGAAHPRTPGRASVR
jgi:hypothetical protein